VQFWILTGLVYVVLVFTTGYWRYLIPTGSERQMEGFR
jgi:hypothetical protein